MKEIIALDIDGTLTADSHEIPQNVASYLEAVCSRGSEIVLVTGRCFSFAYPPLRHWGFSYYLAVNNGAIILKMPEKKIIFTQYIDPVVLKELDQIADEEKTDFALYTGVENNDLCYFRPDRFPLALREYVRERVKMSRENWIEVKQFDKALFNFLASIKFFGEQERIYQIQEQVEERLRLNIPVIRDPFCKWVFIAQATHPDVSKGCVINFFKNQSDAFVISAGDDFNDFSMLQKADVKIVMETAPDELKAMADVVAKPADKLGIIEALEYVRNHWI